MSRKYLLIREKAFSQLLSDVRSMQQRMLYMANVLRNDGHIDAANRGMEKAADVNWNIYLISLEVHGHQAQAEAEFDAERFTEPIALDKLYDKLNSDNYEP